MDSAVSEKNVCVCDKDKRTSVYEDEYTIVHWRIDTLSQSF